MSISAVPKLVSTHTQNRGSRAWVEHQIDPTKITPDMREPSKKNHRSISPSLKVEKKKVTFSPQKDISKSDIVLSNVQIPEICEPGFRILVKLPEIEVLGLIDTGSDISIVRKDLINPYTIEGIQGVPLITANKSHLTLVGTTLLTFKLGPINFQYRFLVTEILAVPLIIGNDFAYSYFEGLNFQKNFVTIVDPTNQNTIQVPTQGAIRPVANYIQSGEPIDEHFDVQDSKYLAALLPFNEILPETFNIEDKLPEIYACAFNLTVLEPKQSARVEFVWRPKLDSLSCFLEPTNSLLKKGLVLKTTHVPNRFHILRLVIENPTETQQILYPATKLAKVLPSRVNMLKSKFETPQPVLPRQNQSNQAGKPESPNIKVLKPENCLINEN